MALRPLTLMVSVAVAPALGASSARAQCSTELPVPGLEVRVCADGGLRYHVLRVDLSAGDLALRVSAPSERGQLLEGWAGAVPGAVAALPAGDFRFPSLTPLGLTVGEGQDWGVPDDGLRAVLAFDERALGVFAPAPQLVPYEPWMVSALSGVPVLRAGVPVEGCTGAGCERRSRSGVGLDRDARFLVAVVAEGDRASSVGVTDPELGALLAEAGAFDGLRSAQGAVSELWVGGAVVSPSSDGASRPGAAFLAVVDRASGRTTRLRGVVGVEGRAEEFLPDATVRVETLDGRVVAEGTPVTEGGYWEFTVPVREYIVRASHAGYRSGCKVCAGVAGEDVWCSLFLAPGEGSEECAPPPRVLDVGPWPEAPPATGTPDAGAAMDGGGGGGCAASTGGRGSGWCVALGLWALRRRRRR